MRRAENLNKLKTRRLQELSKRDRSRIDKRKYYGIGVEIQNYYTEIFNTFYDPELFKSLVSKNAGAEALEDDWQKYLSEISGKLQGLKDKIQDFFYNAFNKGSKRVLTKDGDQVQFGEVQDTRAIDFMINQQVQYFKGLTEDQSKRVLKIIADGRNAKKTSAEISKEIQSSVKTLTKARCNTIARTEIVKAHNQGQVQTMKELGVDTYRYITANDNNVAAICKKNQGPRGRERIYKIDLAGTPANPLPVINSHPNCRCTIVVDKFKPLNK